MNTNLNNNNLNKEKSKTMVERRKEFACQICKVNEAVVKLESGSLQIHGTFCQPCAILRLEKWYCWSEEIEKEIKVERRLKLMEVRMDSEKDFKIEGQDFVKAESSKEIPQFSPEFLKKKK